MQTPSLTREELYDIQGQLYILKIIDNLPKDVDNQLQSLLEQEDRKRELKEL